MSLLKTTFSETLAGFAPLQPTLCRRNTWPPALAFVFMKAAARRAIADIPAPVAALLREENLKIALIEDTGVFHRDFPEMEPQRVDELLFSLSYKGRFQADQMAILLPRRFRMLQDPRMKYCGDTRHITLHEAGHALSTVALKRSGLRLIEQPEFTEAYRHDLARITHEGIRHLRDANGSVALAETSKNADLINRNEVFADLFHESIDGPGPFTRHLPTTSGAVHSMLNRIAALAPKRPDVEPAPGSVP